VIAMPFDDEDTESPMEITSAVVSAGVLVTVTGEIDNTNAYRLEEAASAAVQQEGAAVVAVDLTQVEYLGSGGLRALAAMASQAQERGTPLRFVTGERYAVARPIELAGLSAYLPLSPSIADALARAGRASAGGLATTRSGRTVQAAERSRPTGRRAEGAGRGTPLGTRVIRRKTAVTPRSLIAASVSDPARGARATAASRNQPRPRRSEQL